MMVENAGPAGSPAPPVGAVACITLSSVLVGSSRQSRGDAQSRPRCCCGVLPLISLAMGASFVREAPARSEGAAFRETWRAIRGAAFGRELWIVAGFIFFFWFSPSFGPAFLYYQTDTLGSVSSSSAGWRRWPRWRG